MLQQEWGQFESLNSEDFPWRIRRSLSQHYACSKTMGNFSSNTGDDNEDVNKTMDLLSKPTTLYLHHTYFAHFLVAAA